MGSYLTYLCADETKSNSTISDCPAKGMQFTLSFIETKFSGISHKSTNELYDKINANDNNDELQIVVLDIREEKEYNLSHIPGAIWMSPNETPQSIIEKLQNEHDININVNSDDEDKKEMDNNNVEIYCYCSVGYRSSIMTDKLQRHGLKNVHNLHGSIFKWVNEGKPIVDNDGDNIDQVHTYNQAWGVLLDDKNKRVC